MTSFDNILAVSPFSLNEAEKDKLLTERLLDLTRLHFEKCSEYSAMLNAIGFNYIMKMQLKNTKHKSGLQVLLSIHH